MCGTHFLPLLQLTLACYSSSHWSAYLLLLGQLPKLSDPGRPPIRLAFRALIQVQVLLFITHTFLPSFPSSLFVDLSHLSSSPALLAHTPSRIKFQACSCSQSSRSTSFIKRVYPYFSSLHNHIPPHSNFSNSSSPADIRTHQKHHQPQFDFTKRPWLPYRPQISTRLGTKIPFSNYARRE